MPKLVGFCHGVEEFKKKLLSPKVPNTIHILFSVGRREWAWRYLEPLALRGR